MPAQDMDEATLQTESRSAGNERNAFAELMAPKPKQEKLPRADRRSVDPSNPRNALLSYIAEPSRFPGVVISHTDHSVLVRDKFPKATVHLLLLPRDEAKMLMNPRDALDDPAFLSMVRSEAEKAVQVAASELSRLVSPYSTSCKDRMDAMRSDEPPDVLPPGRDFTQDFRVGIHAHPSMNHLHVHVISRDMHSDRLKHQKHYNSFNTDFFIPLQDFPLGKDDVRRRTSHQNANLKREYRCWRCGQGFGNQFKQLKQHLEVEFEAWRRE